MSEPIIRQPRRAAAIQFGALSDWSQFDIDFFAEDLPADFEGFRILHLSDTHFGPRWSGGYDRLLEYISQLNVDLIAFTGDWVEDKFDYRLGVDCAQRFARGLKARLGVWGVLGNHDGDLLARPMIEAGVNLLVGESRRIVGAEGALEIIGLNGVTRDDASRLLIDSFGDRPPHTFRLVMTHYPDDVKRLIKMRPNLVLAGHTHGGQICLPGGRPIFTHDSLHFSHAGGMSRHGDIRLHVSRGVGCSKWPIRTWAPPEISVIRLLKSTPIQA